VAKLLADLSPIRRHPAFRNLWLGSAVSSLGRQLTAITVAYQTYLLTHSTLIVGLVGLVQLAPSVLGSLWGGSLVDAKDRRLVLIGSQVGLALASAGLMLNSTVLRPSLGLIFGCIVLSAGFQAVNYPAQSSIVAEIVPREEIPSASALTGIVSQFALIVGPAIAGVLIATVGVATAYEIDTASFALVLMTSLSLPRLPASSDGASVGVRSVLEGLRYSRRNRFLVSLLVVDFSSMVFGMPKAVFPALALSVYRGGPGVLGLLYSAPAVGAFLASALSGWVRHVHYRGRAVVACMAAWGIAIALLGFIPVLWVGLVLLAIAGAGDMIGGVFRIAAFQTTVPSRFQGRVAGVFYGSAIAANSVGDGEAGVAATIGGSQFAIWSGGLLSLVGIVAVLWRYPDLWRSAGHDVVEFDDLPEAAAAAAAQA
jgi:MFS family permease